MEDVVQVLTDSVDVKQYIKKLKARDEQVNNNWGTICTLVEMIAKEIMVSTSRKWKIRWDSKSRNCYNKFSISNSIWNTQYQK